MQIALLAQQLVDLAESGRGATALASFSARGAIDDSVLVDIASMIVELLSPNKSDTTGLIELRKIIQKF